jgi:hypothetical protein
MAVVLVVLPLRWRWCCALVVVAQDSLLGDWLDSGCFNDDGNNTDEDAEDSATGASGRGGRNDESEEEAERYPEVLPDDCFW